MRSTDITHEALNVCARTVARDLCIGCGVCAAICPQRNLRMRWTKLGTLAPADGGRCSTACRLCLEACPFQDGAPHEDAVAHSLYGDIGGIRHKPETGYVLAAYAGYAGGGYRPRGASGGMASWFLARLLETGRVDHVLCVRPRAESDCLFEYAVLSAPADVSDSSRSAYYPVELSQVLRHVMEHNGQFAVIAVPCFAKAIRRAQEHVPALKRRIAVVAGLVCGQTKSKGFSDYLIARMGLDLRNVAKVIFRSKNPDQPAGNFDMRATLKNGGDGVCSWQGGVYGETWASGLFTPRACQFCDDTFAETADIVFMDAWLPEYERDRQGTSIVLARSWDARRTLEKGMADHVIALHPLPIDKVIASQAGVVFRKRDLLANRLWIERNKKGQPLKRVVASRPNWFRRLLLEAQENIRKKGEMAYVLSDPNGPNRMDEFHKAIQVPQCRLQAMRFAGVCYSRLRSVMARLLPSRVKR